MRSSKAQISRDRILDGARDLILTRGFAAMSIDAVCESASITKGGFFHHFPSKDALGEAVLDKFWNDVETRQAGAAYRNHEDPLSYLSGYLDFAIDSYAEPNLQKGCILAIYTMELAESNATLFKSASQRFADWRSDLIQMISKASQCTGKALDVETWSDLYISTLEGALLITKSNKDPEAIKRLVGLYKRLLFDALGSDVGG